MAKSFAVIGAGFRGFCDSLELLKIPGAEVHLIEPAPFFGGVMQSMQALGFNVDKGVHVFDSIPKALGEIVDEIMEGRTRTIDFVSASAFNGRVTDGFSLPDLSSLDPETRSRIALELIELATKANPDSDARNLADLFKIRYGETAGRIFCSIFRHVYGLEAERAEATAISQTSLGRLKFLDDAEMLVLKANPWLDTVLAARRKAMGKVDDYVSIYPDTGEAMRGWCERAETWLRAKGAKVSLGEKVLNLAHSNGGVAVKTNLRTLEVDRVVWSNDNVSALAKALSVRETASESLSGTAMLFVTLVTQAKHMKDFTYLQNFDPDGVTYRTAALGVFSGQVRDDGTSFLTCECPVVMGSPAWNAPDTFAEKAWSECQRLGIVSSEATLVESQVTPIPTTFKIALSGYHERIREFHAEVAAANSRVILRDVVPFFRRDIYLDSLKLRDLVG